MLHQTGQQKKQTLIKKQRQNTETENSDRLLGTAVKADVASGIYGTNIYPSKSKSGRYNRDRGRDRDGSLSAGGKLVSVVVSC